MKSVIIMLATLGGIGIGIAEASASDAQNLSCITETSADGKTVRDCEPNPEPEIYVLQYIVDPDSPTPPPTFGRDGGRKADGDRRGERERERGGTIH